MEIEESLALTPYRSETALARTDLCSLVQIEKEVHFVNASLPKLTTGNFIDLRQNKQNFDSHYAPLFDNMDLFYKANIFDEETFFQLERIQRENYLIDHCYTLFTTYPVAIAAASKQIPLFPRSYEKNRNYHRSANYGQFLFQLDNLKPRWFMFAKLKNKENFVTSQKVGFYKEIFPDGTKGQLHQPSHAVIDAFSETFHCVFSEYFPEIETSKALLRLVGATPLFKKEEFEDALQAYEKDLASISGKKNIDFCNSTLQRLGSFDSTVAIISPELEFEEKQDLVRLLNRKHHFQKIASSSSGQEFYSSFANIFQEYLRFKNL